MAFCKFSFIKDNLVASVDGSVSLSLPVSVCVCACACACVCVCVCVREREREREIFLHHNSFPLSNFHQKTQCANQTEVLRTFLLDQWMILKKGEVFLDNVSVLRGPGLCHISHEASLVCANPLSISGAFEEQHYDGIFLIAQSL